MIYKKEIELSVKILFLSLQIILIFAGVGTIVIVLPLYFRINNIAAIMFKYIIPILIESFLCISTSCSGFFTLFIKNKYMYLLFICSLAALLNLQIIMIFKTIGFEENVKPWINENWTNFNNQQRKYLQDQFNCCGLEFLHDRHVSDCKYTQNCMKAFLEIVRSLQKISHSFIFMLFVIETLSIVLLAFIT